MRRRRNWYIVADDNNTRECAVFDIDGTLCDPRWRFDRLDPASPDWDDFHSRQHHDKPLEAQVRLMEMLWDGGFYIVVLTSRPSQYRDQTAWWLKRHAPAFHELLMPNSGNEWHFSKVQALQALTERLNVRLLLDDDIRMIEAATELQIPAMYIHSNLYDQTTWGTRLRPAADLEA